MSRRRLCEIGFHQFFLNISLRALHVRATLSPKFTSLNANSESSLVQIFSRLKKKNFSIHEISAGKKNRTKAGQKSFSEASFFSSKKKKRLEIIGINSKKNLSINSVRVIIHNNNRCESSRIPFVHNEE